MPTDADDFALEATAPLAPTGDVLPRGATIGRYVVLSQLGAGAMGVVYAAYDPELDRKIALKLLATSSGADASTAKARLLREAQAMAKLAHPNVVTVYDAGTFRDQVFLAMEYVAGTTLSGWLAERARTHREIVSVFVAAGNGLAAAHAAGVVHRDFKPDNVMVARDGAVRVMDFGLARAMGEDDEAPRSTYTDLRRGAPALALELTRTGVRMGTPLYMSPEQFTGALTDARTDEFSFSVALYVALYGERPFAGDTLQDLVTSVLGGELRPPPEGTTVPPFVFDALARGMRTDPEARFGSVGELLTALTRDPDEARRKGRSRWLAAVGALGAIAAIGLGLSTLRATPMHRCDGGDAKLVGVWDGPRRDAIRDAFRATQAPFADDAWAGVERALGGHATRWLKMHRAACEATARGEQSAELLDLRMECLERRREELLANSELLLRPDTQIVKRALQASLALPPVETCADTETLRERARTPGDAAQKTRAAELRRRLPEAEARREAGKYEDGLAIAHSIATAAAEIPFRPLEADALLAEGRLEYLLGRDKASEATLLRAVFAAEAGRNDEASAMAWASLVFVVGYKQARAEDALALHAERARAAIERLGGHASLAETFLANNLGLIHQQRGRYAEARREGLRALEIATRARGEESPSVAAALNNLGVTEEGAGRSEEALDFFSRVLAINVKLYGTEHPDVGLANHNVGASLLGLRRFADAEVVHRRALHIWERSLGNSHLYVGGALGGVSLALFGQGRLSEARSFRERALEVFDRVAHDQPHRGQALTHACEILEAAGDLGAATARANEAMEIFLKTEGPEHPDTAHALLCRADAALGAHQPKDALVDAERALAILEKVRLPDHPDLAQALTTRWRAEIGLGRAGAAIAPLERALAIRASAHEAPSPTARTRFALARALFEGGGDRRRALDEGGRAKDESVAGGERSVRDRHEVEAWLAKHGGV